MLTSTLTRVAHRAVVLNPGVRAAAANSSRHFFIPSTVIPIQRSSAPHYYNQQRFATVDTSANRRGSGANMGKATETAAADIDSDLDYPTAMDERYSTKSMPGAKASGGNNTFFYLAMGAIGLTGAYIVLKPNPSASSEPGVDARSSSSQVHDSPAHRPLNSKTEKMIGRSG